MTRLFVALIALGFACLASGCGQSGPLYIPGDPSRIESAPPPQEEGEEEQDENDENNDKQ